jgi:hypothetical protein
MIRSAFIAFCSKGKCYNGCTIWTAHRMWHILQCGGSLSTVTLNISICQNLYPYLQQVHHASQTHVNMVNVMKVKLDIIVLVKMVFGGKQCDICKLM